MKIKNSFEKFILVLVLFAILSILLAKKQAYTDGSTDPAYQKGIVYLNQFKPDEAIIEFNKVIKLYPRSDKGYEARARAYKGIGRREEALKDYTQVIKINSPETIQSAYNNRGFLYKAAGDLDKAINDFTAGIKAVAKPKSQEFIYLKIILHRNRAKAYFQKKEYSKALEDVRSIEKLGGSVEPDFIAKLKNQDLPVGSK